MIIIIMHGVFMHKFHKYISRYIALILTFIFILSPIIVTGCGNKADIEPDNINELNKENASISFNSICDDFFRQELSSNTLSLHYNLISPENFGIENYNLSIGHFTEKQRLDSISSMQNYLNKLTLISYDSLSDEDKITYDIFKWYITENLALSNYKYFDEPLSPSIGLQAQLPIIFAEYKFRTAKDIDEYLQLLNLFPAYIDEICDYEKEKANAGMFMADFTADRIINSCKTFLSDSENNFLISSFNEKINAITDLQDSQKTDFIAKNSDIVKNAVFPAYNRIIETLTSLKGKGQNTGGLCGFKNGKEYYEQLLKCNIGSSRSLDNYIALVNSKLQADLTELATILENNESIIENIENITISETDTTKILENLRSKMTSDFPESIDCTYNIKEISENLQSMYSPAFYLTPPIDSANENVIYINPAYNSEPLTLFSTLAHEGFPGHMYQNLYSTSCMTKPVRSLFSFTGYAEGYATYVENMSYNYLDFDDNIKKILAISNSISLGLYARLDLAIHGEGYTYNQTHDFLVKYGITDSETTKEIYQAIIEQPGNYMCYYGGYLEFLELRNEFEKNNKDNFSLKEFHNYILSMGDTPFDILKKYMK